MKKFIFGILLAGLLVGCTNKSDAEKALRSMGFTNIQVTGYNMLACSQEDTYHTGFVATNPQGRRVSGTVCSGLFFKDATVRF